MTQEPITGFSLFALCHFFGLRGRAMVHSLASQTGCDVPIRLTVFYNRQADADLLLEGALGAQASLDLRVVHVPAEKVLQRAMHFALAGTMHDLSHTVFCDMDLWFPPPFWAEYLSALRVQPRGYWSCRVMNVPLPEANRYVNQWGTITEGALKERDVGRRYDCHTGHAGNFQCIPRGLVSYPADPRVGVEGVDLEFAKLAIEHSESKAVERRLGKICAYHLDHPMSWFGTGGAQL